MDIMNVAASTTNSTDVANAFLGALVGVMFIAIIFIIVVAVLEIVGLWKSFSKAGQPGWAAIIPIYNIWVFIKTAKMEWFHFVILMALIVLSSLDEHLPDYVITISTLAGVIYWFVINLKFAKAFGKGVGMAIVCFLFPYIGYMILGFGSAKYE